MNRLRENRSSILDRVGTTGRVWRRGLLRLVSLVMVLGALAVRAADAQVCSGRSSFNLANTHAELNMGASRSGRAVGISVGHGADALFATVAGTRHWLEGERDIYTVAGLIGSDQPLTPDNRLHACPMLTLAYERDASGTSRGGRVGVSASGDASLMLVNTGTMRVMPTIALDLRLTGVSRIAALLAHEAGRHRSTFSGGVGFVMWNRLSIAPRVVIPFGSVDRSGFQISVGYNHP